MSDTLQLFDVDAPPRARTTDPSTSHEAAEVIAPGNSELVEAIRKYVTKYGMATAWQIAAGVRAANPGRWQEDSIRSACARADLVKLEGWGESPGGRRCCLYTLSNQYQRTEPVEIYGDRL